jgi:serine/threonine protein kinase/WD40 repeat protein
MEPSDSLQIDEHLARLLAAYDPAIEGADSKAPTISVKGKPRAASPNPAERVVPQLSSGSIPQVSRDIIVPDPDATEAEWLANSSLTPPPSNGTHRVGRFELRKQLGKGGCGIVFLAFDPKLEREVALKIPRPEMLLSADARRRLVREALAAAEFDHPNLVPVYESGEIGPVCFIATAYCPGLTLGEWLDKQAYPVSVRQAARLMATLADALQHAHDRGVLHRDLKPNNIILQSLRDDPNAQDPPLGSIQLRGDHFIPRVVDFGLAKLLERGGPSETMTRQVLGTPKYMAPEQAQARHNDVGPAADVYALGVILYELLTGRAPFEGSSDVEVLRQAIDGHLVQPRHLRVDVPRDLEAICLKAMSRAPERRYRTAIDFADDLRRFLDGKPTIARPLKWLGRAGRWLRRNDQAVALIVVTTIATVLLLFGVMSTYQSRQYRSDRDKVLVEQAERTRADQQREYAQNIREGFLAWRSGDQRAAGNYLEIANRLSRARSEPTDFSYGYLRRLIALEQKTFVCQAGAVTALAVSPDGKFLATGHGNGIVSLWLQSSGAMVGSQLSHEHAVIYLSFKKNDELVSADASTTGKVWRVSSSGSIAPGAQFVGAIELPLTSLPSVRWGDHVYTGSEHGIVRCWNFSGEEEGFHAESVGSSIIGAAVNPEGSRFAMMTSTNQLLFYNGITRQAANLSLPGKLLAMHYPKEPSVLAIVVQDGVVIGYDCSPEDATERFRIHPENGLATAVDLTPDGLKMAVGDERGQVKIWALSDRRLLASLDTAEQLPIKKLAVSNDGKFFAAHFGDRIGLYNVDEIKPIAKFGSDDQTVFRFSPDGSRLLMTGRGGVIKVWGLYLGYEEYKLYGHTSQVTGLTISPNGRTLVSGGLTGEVFFWDLRVGQESMSFSRHEGPVTAVKFAANGKFLVTGGKDLALWQAAKD